LAQLLGREHELLHAWRAQGWRDVQQTQPNAPVHAGMPGPSHSPDRCPRCGEAVVRSDATVTGAPRWACGHCYHVWDAARTDGDRRTGPRERRRVTRRDRRKPSR
jgi:ribosomal protein S27AE